MISGTIHNHKCCSLIIMIIEISKIGRLIIITSKSVLIDFPMPGILGKAKKLIAKYTTTTTIQTCL